jgi:hypothetical protein
MEGNVTLQCNCKSSNCQKFHGITRRGEINQASVQINAVALCAAHIVCACSDGSLLFYDGQYKRVHDMQTGGTSVKFLVSERFMEKDLLFWSMDVLIPTLGGVPVGVVQMMDFASLTAQAADPPKVTVMVSNMIDLYECLIFNIVVLLLHVCVMICLYICSVFLIYSVIV